jgi:hypothetical protein
MKNIIMIIFVATAMMGILNVGYAMLAYTQKCWEIFWWFASNGVIMVAAASIFAKLDTKLTAYLRIVDAVTRED